MARATKTMVAAVLAAILLPVVAGQVAASMAATRATARGIEAAPTARHADRAVVRSLAATATSYVATDPATWSSAQLASQMAFIGVSANDMATARTLSARGVGGIILMGDTASTHLGSQLAKVRSMAPHGIPPFLGSDEEGGAVQRLRHVIYALPSAKTMGKWSPKRIRATALAYGKRMRRLGVLMDFAPVADLDVNGAFIHRFRRAFSGKPSRVATDVVAWIDGMTKAGIASGPKHWPGHGRAADTHGRAARVPSLARLKKSDLVPFEAAFRRGVPLVMVGHLRSSGLTEGRLPASESRKALTYLRSRVGTGTLVVTDSLSMGAASSALHISPATAAARAIAAGADMAMVCSGSPKRTVEAIRKAIDAGRIPRARAVASVERILRLKAQLGLVRP
jgi:beta-N-acetylhexosaminidase